MKDVMAKVDESGDVHLMRNGSYKVVAADADLDTEERTNGKYESKLPLRFSTEQEEIREMDACQPTGKDYSCGLCALRPKWLQRFANKQAFLVTFCLTSVLQGMYQTYFVSVLTTIEKLYQIQSTTTGIILSATEVGQIGGVLLLTYYGARGHRPKWIACGTLVFALASIISSSPHFLFGRETVPLLSNNKVDNLSDHHLRSKLCVNRNSSFSQLLHATSNISDIAEHPYVNLADECQHSNSHNAMYFALPLFFVTRLLIGIGSTAVTTLGIPYIDDNVAPKESPVYFGITIGVRIFGPVFGFLLGAMCTGVYVGFPFEQSVAVTPNDPQWIGAWWLGVVIVGISLLFTSVIMMAFPRKLPRPDPSSYCHKQRQNSLQEQRQIQQQQKQPLMNGQHSNEKSSKSAVVNHGDGKPNLKDFPSAMKRLLRNEVLILRTASSVLHILPIAGVYTFLPKFLESQFQLTAGEASFICGIAGVLVMGFGVLASGIFMRKFKPSPRFVAQWIACSAFLYAIGMIILMWLGCPLNNIVGLNVNDKSGCGGECMCPKGEYSPICVNENITYISPCLAGCSKLTAANESFVFSNCVCLTEGLVARNGPCPLNCDNLIWYTLIFALFVLVHSTSEVGSMLLTLRCVAPEDKAMALGLISFAIGLFGNVPCPIIYGSVVDSACLFWEYNCGKPGACRVYDPSKFRLVFHGLTAFIMFIAFIVDSFVWYKASSITFHEEERAEENDDRNKVVDGIPQSES